MATRKPVACGHNVTFYPPYLDGMDNPETMLGRIVTIFPEERRFEAGHSLAIAHAEYEQGKHNAKQHDPRSVPDYDRLKEYAQSQPSAMMIEGTGPGVIAAVRSAMEAMKSETKTVSPTGLEGLYAAQTARKKVSGKTIKDTAQRLEKTADALVDLARLEGWTEGEMAFMTAMKMRAVASSLRQYKIPRGGPEKRSLEDRFLQRLVEIFNRGMHGDDVAKYEFRAVEGAWDTRQRRPENTLGEFLSHAFEVIRPEEPRRLMTSINKDLMRLFPESPENVKNKPKKRHTKTLDRFLLKSSNFFPRESLSYSLTLGRISGTVDV
jgi:hypothetical protein